MLEKLFQDLRFVIGLFFGIISLILLVAGNLYPSDFNLNWMASAYIGAFSVFMLVRIFY